MQYCIVDKGMKVGESFKKSAEITKGYKWKLFFLGFILIGINILGLLCLGVGLFITVPWTSLLTPIIFRKLCGDEPAVDVVEVQPV